MKAYKGFNADMTCRGFKYEEGREYETDSSSVCKFGLHACENPIDCLQYYYPNKSVYREVEIAGEIDRGDEDDTKVAATKIKIGAELSIPALCKATFEYVRSKCKNERKDGDAKTVTAGDKGVAMAGNFGVATAGRGGAAAAGLQGMAIAFNCGSAEAGDYGVATAGRGGSAEAGDYGVATAGRGGASVAGDYGVATTFYGGASVAGDYGVAAAGDSGAAKSGDGGSATAGYRGSATAGHRGAAAAGDGGTATSGDIGAATAGEKGAATAGKYGAATSRGSVSVGEEGVGTVRATRPKIKGGMGAVLTIAKEREYDCDIVWCKSFKIDGKKYKPDTWYTLKGGKVVEARDEDWD